MESERKELLHYRLERAREALAESEHLLGGNFVNTAASRLYYACFYAVSALLAADNLSSKTHKGARALFGKHFVSTGLVSLELGKIYSELFDFRQEGDYEDFIVLADDDVRLRLEDARAFVVSISALVEKRLSE